MKPVRAAWSAKNVDHRKAYGKVYHADWYEKNREAKQAAAKAYREADPERAAEQARKGTRKWQAKNPEKTKAYTAKWYADRDNRAAHTAKRRALKVAAGGSHTPADLRVILAAQHHRCAYCAADLRKTKRHLDHIMPLSRGGSNDRTNLQYTCGPCNLSKGAQDPAAFARSLGRLI